MSGYSHIRRFGGRTLLAVSLTLALAPGLYGQKDANRGWLGIDFPDTGEPRITRVWDGSPADKGGLQVGDVILSVNGSVLANQDDWGGPFETLQIGQPAEMVVQRGDRRVTLTVVPGTQEDAFGEEVWMVEVTPGHWDSVYVQIMELQEEQAKLKSALREAERTLARVEIQQPLSDEQQQIALALRTQIDSINLALSYSYQLIRVQTDSIAARTLYISPKVEMSAPAQVEVVVPGASETRTITIYNDAVAGARFKVLDEEKAAYFHVDGGLLVFEVVENTPAYNAGLREFDVVTEVNGQPVTSIREFRRLINSGPVELTYVRKGQKATCTIGND